MTATIQMKQMYARGSRHRGECYGAVLDPTPGSLALAFLRVESARESLIYRASPQAEDIVLARDTYVLSPHFAGGYLFWVERIGDAWQLCAVPAQAPAIERMITPIPTMGRPIFLNSCTTADGAVLVWEERQGKRTQVRLVRIANGAIGTPIEVTDGRENAYDPACCVTNDGSLYVIYCAFNQGQYRILLQQMTGDASPIGVPILVSNQADACVYPSVCARRDGGVWFSYACLHGGKRIEHSYVLHPRYLAQLALFANEAKLYAGLFADGRIYAPFAPPNPNGVQGNIAAMIVYGSELSGHSQVFEDANGRLRLLARQHQAIDASVYEGDTLLRRSALQGAQAPTLNHPAIVLFTLEDRTWSAPETLVPRAHIEATLSWALEGDRLRIAFTEDGRQTNWSTGSEWFDDESEVGVGVLQRALPATTAPQYDLRPYAMRPRQAPGIANPPLPNGDGGPYIYAVGQTHAHTNLSICCRAADRDQHMNYRFMQDVQHSDFGATTDHDYNMWHTEMLLVHKLAAYYYFPGEFVAFPAYEWTGSGACTHEGGPWGHVNPLYLEEDGEMAIYTPVDPTCAGGSLPRLWLAYGGKKIVTPPHHVADNIHWYNWQVYDPQFVPVIELFQDMRGSAEQPWAPGVTNWLHQEEGHWVLPELRAGKRFGFIASADHCGIARAGTLVTALTRTALYEALTARRTFATTSIALQVAFTANGQMMGSEVETELAEFRLYVRAPEPIAEVHIVQNGDTVVTLPAEGLEVQHAWQVCREQSGEFWYCRILLDNGELAWTSPIWLV